MVASNHSFVLIISGNGTGLSRSSLACNAFEDVHYKMSNVQQHAVKHLPRNSARHSTDLMSLQLVNALQDKQYAAACHQAEDAFCLSCAHKSS